jgi:predicted neuraminidase
MSNGDWLFPIYYSTRTYRKGGDYTVIRISEDKGKTWQEFEVPESRGRVQAAVVELEPGHLAGFMRSRSSDRIYVTRSSDYGRTWTPAERTVLPNNNASTQTIKLASGNLAIIYNHYSANDDPDITLWPIPRHRYPTRVAISEDGGYTWPHMRDIDSSDDFAGESNRSLNRRCDYPCIIQTRDGALHAAYSYRDRQCIKYVRFSEEWIREQLDFLIED